MSSSKPQIVASTIGFEQPAWNQQYYPEECPLDWRLAYFMNDFRAVYLTADRWANQHQLLAEIADEMDADFDLVIEWPAHDAHEIEPLLSQLSPLKHNITSIVLTVHEANDRALLKTLRALTRHYPISLRSSAETDAALISLAKQHQTSVVWYPEQDQAPLLSRHYQVVILPGYELRALKSTLDKLGNLLASEVRAGLFFEPTPQSPERAMQTRELIELLGMA